MRRGGHKSPLIAKRAAPSLGHLPCATQQARGSIGKQCWEVVRRVHFSGKETETQGRGLAHIPWQSLDLNSHLLVPPPWPGDPVAQEKGLIPHTLAAPGSREGKDEGCDGEGSSRKGRR